MWQVQIEDIDKQNGTYSGGSTGGSITEPITLAQAKSYLRVDFTDDDTLITSLITQCRIAIENYCNISIVPKVVTGTFRMSYRPITSNMTQYQVDQAMDPFELPYGPVLSVISATGFDSQNNSYPLVQNQDYYLTGTKFMHIRFINPQDVQLIMYQAGYTAFSGVIVPEDLTLATMAEIAYRYDNRGDIDKLSGICNTAVTMADPYRRLFWQ